MIPIKRARKPPSFNKKVRDPGMRFLLGTRLHPPVPDERWKGKRFWRRAIPDLHEAYGGYCAFTAFRIHRVTGGTTVEHFKPKSKYPRLAYEWSNFRLVCGLMNARKRDHEDVLDPFTLPPDTFDLNAVSGEIIVHNGCPPGIRTMAESTIKRLKLNDLRCRAQRLDDSRRIMKGERSPEDSPFVARCLEAQGLL